MTEAPIRLFVFGLGYTATAFVRAIAPRAEWIGGTVRTVEKAAALAGEGFVTAIFDGRSSGTGVREGLAEATHVLVSIPPGEASDPVLAHHHDDILMAPRIRAIAYLSTVGVYGDYGGAWVDERTIPHPSHERTKSRLKAEAAWMKLADRKETPLAIFRIAGIYGPGRNALVKLAEGRAHRIAGSTQVSNRIHVADIASVLTAALARPDPRIYNLADDEPAPPGDVVAYAAGLMRVEPPREVSLAEADLSDMARSFFTDNRRVANRRIKQELGVTLRYPTYRDGLSEMWREGNWRG